MTNTWWTCRACGTDLYDSQGVYAHKTTTGHNDAAVAMPECAPGPGSTDEGRAAARALYEHVRRNKTEESASE